MTDAAVGAGGVVATTAATTATAEEGASPRDDTYAIPPHRTGMEGRLHLSLHRDDARTVLGSQRAEPPLSVQRALYCEELLPDMAYVYITSTSGGMLQGDRHITRFDLGAGARAHITTQGATRIYGDDGASPGMRKPAARSSLRMSLGENSYLEYMPDQIIPYAGSRFQQDADISVHETATLAYVETVTPGRVGMGESFAYKSCNLKMRVTDQDGRFRFIDAARMEPRAAQPSLSQPSLSQPSLRPQSKNKSELDIKSFGIMAGYDIVSSLYVITQKKHVDRLQKDIDGIILRHDKIAGGATTMRGNTGVMARLLGPDTESVKSAITEAAAYARKIILNAPFTDIRKS